MKEKKRAKEARWLLYFYFFPSSNLNLSLRVLLFITYCNLCSASILLCRAWLLVHLKFLYLIGSKLGNRQLQNTSRCILQFLMIVTCIQA